MSDMNFPVDPVMTGITLAYKNKEYLADRILPRVGVQERLFSHYILNKGDQFTVPNTDVGRKSSTNEVEFGMTEVQAEVKDRGLHDFIPADDYKNASGGFDPEANAVEAITNLILLDREIRVGTMIFDAANYGSDNKTTLSGTSQFSDYTNSSPIDTIMAGLDAAFMRPNVGILPRVVYSTLVRHPHVVKAINRSSGDKGIATRDDLARLFELEEILVSDGRVNSAKKGQTVTLSRIWGKDALFIYRNAAATPKYDLTFGYTAQYDGRIAGKIPQPTRGLRGGNLVQVGESVKELIVASECAFLIKAAIA